VVDGFVYVSDDDPGPMAGAAAGTTVTKTSLAPPWIVVDHTLDTVIVARWPGRLFRVTSVEPTGADQRAALTSAAEGLRADAGYSRVLAVAVREELPATVLFGAHGEVVATVIGAAGRLDADTAVRLLAARHPGAREAYGRAWSRWLSGQPQHCEQQDDEHSLTLAVHGVGRTSAPVGDGFTVLWDAVTASVRRCAPQSLSVDADGEWALAEPWASAGAALLEAAMAFGAPELVDVADAAALTGAWRSVFG
jgi:hypothetical protein